MIKSIKNGADIINDVSGFNYDPNAISKLKNYNIPKVLHHMQGNPKYYAKKSKIPKCIIRYL